MQWNLHNYKGHFARQVRQNVHRKKQIETEILEQHLKVKIIIIMIKFVT